MAFDVCDRVRIEDEPTDGCGRGADRLSYASLEVARVGEEEPIVEAVDDHARGHARRRMQRDVGIAAEPLDPAQDRVVGTGAAAHGVDHRETDGDDERLQHAEEDDAACGHGRDLTSTGSTAASARQDCGSTSPIAAKTMTAPSTAFGRYCTGSVRRSRITATAEAAKRPAI